MNTKDELKARKNAAIARRNAAVQFSPEYFRAVAEIEDLDKQIAKLTPAPEIPADFDFDWEKHHND